MERPHHRPGALEHLRERGFFAQCTDAATLGERMDQGPVTFYVGLDPTGPSLHIGHLVPIYALAHLATFGHSPIIIMGGGTARIGDPSGKTEMRRMLTVEQIDEHVGRIAHQVDRFLEPLGVTAKIVNNADWLANLNYIDFLRDIGRHFSVNRMLTFESYKQRMESGLSFIEFNYQLLQSYDFLNLFQHHGCTLQIGGDDQWGNIVAGADLIRRVVGPGTESFGLTFPLVTRADGKKMGKTEQGALFLDPEAVSPFDFFQYWRNVPDEDVGTFLKLFTFVDTGAIESIVGADINLAKERLAWEVTTLIHGPDAADGARDAARALFAGGGAAVADAPGGEIDGGRLAEGIGVLALFVEAGLCASNAEARRLVAQGGARINDAQVDDPAAVIDRTWVDAGGLLLRAGKKRYFRFTVVD